MSRLLEIMGGQQTAKQTQTGSRLMQIMDKYEQEQRKREVDAWRKQLASVPTPEPTKTVTTAQEALEAERVRREKGEPLVPFVMKKTMPEPLSMNLADSSTTAGYLANRAISGLASAAEGYESTRKLLQPKTDIPGLPPTQMEYQQQRLTEKRQQDRAETAEAGLGKSGLVRFAGDAIEAASQQIPNTLLGLASGGMGTAGQAAANVLPRVFGSTSMMAQIIGNTYTQATQNGASHKKALQYAVASGILETAVESLFSGMPGMGKGALDGLTDSLTKKIGSRFAKMLAEKGLDMFGEGVEEFVTTMIEPLVQKATIEPDKKIDWKQTVAEALYSFLVGAATAGIMQAPGTVHQAYNINSINNQAKAAERIVNVTQDGKAWELLQQKPVTKMTVEEQVAFIEAIQEDLGIRETNEQTIETKGSRIVETKKAVEQAQVLQPAEQPTSEFKPQESAVENIPVSEEKTEAGQAQAVEATPKKATTFYTGSSNPNITEFKPGGDGSTKQSGDSFGVGVYLTDNPEVAKLYAQGDKGKVYTVTTNNKLLNLNEKANPNFAKTVTEAILEAPKQYRNRMLRDLGRTEKRFTNVNEARNFFEEAEKTWQSEDGEYEGNKPEADKQGDTYIVKYVDFGSNLQSLLENSTNEQIFTAIAALNTNEASGLVTASGYDGIVFKDKGAFNAGIEGNTAVIYRNTKNIKQQPTPQPQQANTEVESKPTLPDTEQPTSGKTLTKTKDKYEVGDSYLYPYGDSRTQVIVGYYSDGRYLVKDSTDDLTTTVFANILTKAEIDEHIKKRNQYIEKINKNNQFRYNAAMDEYNQLANEYLGEWVEKLPKAQQTKTRNHLLNSEKSIRVNIYNNDGQVESSKIYKNPKEMIEDGVKRGWYYEIKTIDKGKFKISEYRLYTEDGSFLKSNKIEYEYFNSIKENGLPQYKGKKPKQPETLKDADLKPQNDSKPTLPDTEQELSDLINKMEEKQRQGIKIDLQLFGAAKTKLSKFRTNTMERTPKIDPQTKRVIESAEAFDPMLFGYTPETNEAWEAEARWNVEHFYEATKRRLENSDSIAGGVATWEFSLIAEKLRNESEKTGDRTEYIEWIQRAASVGREEGRGIQAIRMAWGLDKVDGAVMQVQKTVDEVNKDISDTDPQIKRDKRKIKNSVKKAQKDAGDGVARDIETLTPEELLAKRIQSHVKEVADAKADPIKDMVNELYRIAQESPLPDKDITKRDPMEFVAQAIKNREQYTEVFNKAKEIVEKKFKGNEDALALLDAYFNKEAIPVISKIRLNAAIKNVVRNLGTTIERIAKSGRQTKTEIFKALAGEFITKGNLEQDEAKYLVPFLVDAYDAQVKERAQTILSNMLKTKTKTKGVPFAERVKEIINMGVANEDAMNRVLSEKYNLPKLDNETIQEIMDIYDTVDSEDVKAIKEAIIKESGFTGKQAEKLKDKLGGLAIDEYRAIAMAQVMKKFADRQESSFWRKLSAIQAMGHLLNAVTPMRNVLSNAAMARLEKVSETIASAISKSDVKAGLRYSDTAVQKAKHETKRADIDIILGIDSRRESKGKYDLYRSATFKKGALSAAEKLMSKTLRLPDVYFYELRKQDALERLTAMNGGYLTDDIRKRAEYEAAYSTFMDDSLPARMLDGLKKVGNIAGFGKRKGVLQPAEFGLGDLVIKYAKVPGNIIMRTLEYSPMGYAKALYNMYQAKVGSDNSPMVAREAALAFGRATTGTGLMAIGALMYALGLFVQRKPDEEKGEAALSRAMGLNQGQVNISALGRAITGGKTKAKDGDLLVSISFFEPFATMLVAGASVKQALDEGKTAGETLSLVAGNTAEEILDMPTMAIIQAVFQESQREGTKVWDVMAIPLIKAIPGFVPQPVRSVAKAIDPKTRSTSGKTQKEKALKETMRNLPLVSTLLEPQVDPTGEQYKNLTGEPATSLINYLLNPGYATIYKNIPYKDKLRTLSQAFPDSNLWPRYYAIDSVGDKKLTDKEKTVYMEAFGQYYNKAFENKLKNINVNKLSSTKKQDLIKQLEALRSDALKKGREAVVSYRKKK